MDTHFPILGLTAHSWAMPPSPKTHAVPVGEAIALCGLVITLEERESWPALGRVCDLCSILSESHESGPEATALGRHTTKGAPPTEAM
jgi:hypothetical protein